MRLNSAPADTVEMSGISSVSRFKIQATAKSFAILSNDLYSNKIRAIVRELSTNALDSHVAAGAAETPFDVHLPTQLAPWFSVRDYGVGMTAEEVIGIYSSYFTSTKTDSDDYVGALGLGSKSPFGYTKNFTVMAIKNGEKNLYSAYIDDTGVPCVALMSTSTTDEPTGVEVKLAVDKVNDGDRFVFEAASIYSNFKVKPVFTGRQIEITSHEYVTGEIISGVRVRKSSHGYGNRQHDVVIMGSIEYPVKSDALPSELETTINNGYEIHLPIGSVEMSASREELSYTPQTIAALTQVYIDIANGAEKTFNDTIDGVTDEWQLITIFKDLANVKVFRQFIVKWTKDNSPALITVNGNPGRWFEVGFKPIELNVTELAQTANIRARLIRASSNGTAPMINPSVFRDYSVAAGARGYVVQFNSSEKFESFRFMISQTPGVSRRVQEWARSRRKNQNIFLLTPVDKNQPMDLSVVKRLLLDPPAEVFVPIETIPDLKATPRPKKEAQIHTLIYSRYGRGYSPTVSRNPSGTLKEVNKLPGKKIYIEMYRNKATIDGEEINIVEFMRDLINLNVITDNKIYGVTRVNINTVKRNRNWIHATRLLTKKTQAIQRGLLAQGIREKIVDIGGSLVYDNIEAMRVDESVKIAVRNAKTHDKQATLVKSKFVDFTATDLELEKTAKLLDEIKDKYPLLRFIRDVTPANLVTDYIVQANQREEI